MSKWKMRIGGCTGCICMDCLFWWSLRCGCFDEFRAETDPFIKAHDGRIRKGWSHWDKPGEQDHWCRGGEFYPAVPGDCDRFVQYVDQRIEQCLKAPVSVFQDGFIRCPLVDRIGCEQCMEEWEEGGGAV